MNRISRRSATEAAEALLEAGRTEPVLNYDVELGLARHHHWLRSEAPLPEWASVGSAAKSVAQVAIKTLVSAVLIGGLGVGAWYARGGPQPSAAAVQAASSGAERTRVDSPSVRGLTVSEAEARMATTPIPVPDHGPPSDQPAHQPVRPDAADKRTTRAHRAHKERASARQASARAERESPRRASAAVARTGVRPDAPAPRVASAAAASASPSEDVNAARAAPREVAAAPEREPISARAEPRPQAQGPSDLAEMQQVATAEQLLERSPARALALVRQGDQRFARGYFQQERAYIAIMALFRLGRIEEARARAASFAERFPALPYGARIRSALEAQEAAAHGATQRDAVP